jgi:hypothetical protein
MRPCFARIIATFTLMLHIPCTVTIVASFGTWVSANRAELHSQILPTETACADVCWIKVAYDRPDVVISSLACWPHQRSENFRQQTWPWPNVESCVEYNFVSAMFPYTKWWYSVLSCRWLRAVQPTLLPGFFMLCMFASNALRCQHKHFIEIINLF